MKNFTLSLAAALLAVFFSFSYAQTTILEQDGASNEFVIAEWVIDGPCFANTNQVNVCNAKSGTLSITNSTSYTNIKVELHFSQTNAISFNLDLMDASTGVLTKTGVISDNTGTPNKAVISYNNATAFLLKKMKFYSPSMNSGITYLKITGTASGSTVSIEENVADNIGVVVQPSHLLINVPADYQLKLYSGSGQILGNYSLKSGENTIENAYSGLLFLVVSDQNNTIIARKKVMR